MAELTWIVREVSQGLQKLRVLSLEGTPPADALVATGQVWCDVLLALPVGWREDVDAPRIREGFRKLAGQVDRWPAPKQLIELLPDRPVPKALPEPRMPPEEAKKKVRELLDKINREMGNGG